MCFGKTKQCCEEISKKKTQSARDFQSSYSTSSTKIILRVWFSIDVCNILRGKVLWTKWLFKKGYNLLPNKTMKLRKNKLSFTGPKGVLQSKAKAFKYLFCEAKLTLKWISAHFCFVEYIILFSQVPNSHEEWKFQKVSKSLFYPEKCFRVVLRNCSPCCGSRLAKD